MAEGKQQQIKRASGNLIFDRLVKDHGKSTKPFGRCASYEADDEKITQMGRLRGQTSPQDVVVSRIYPGIKTIAWNGEKSDEAIGYALAAELTTSEALYAFSNVLSQPTIAQAIIATLLPRANYAIKRGTYLIEEDKVAEATRDVLSTKGETRTAVVAAFSHVMVATLSHLGLVLRGQEQKIVKISSSYVLDIEDLERLVLVDAMKDLFTEQRLSQISKELNQDSVPAVIATVISRNLRTISQLIPEISLRIRQLHLAERVITTYLADPTALSEVIQAYPTLHTLANYANFIVGGRNAAVAGMIAEANSDIKDALDNILTVISSTTAIDVIPLSKLRDNYGFIPASVAGLYKGGVLYATSGQQSKMAVYEALEMPVGYVMRQQPFEYAPISKMADEINRTLMHPSAMRGLANIVADEMSAAPFEIGNKPTLKTIGISETEMLMLALAMASSVSFTSSGNEVISTLAPVYGVVVGEQWLMHASASAGSEVYYSDFATAILYAYGTKCAENGNSEIEGVGLQSKAQSLELPIFAPVEFVGNFDFLLSNEIQKPFSVRLPTKLQIAGDKPVDLTLIIPLLPVLLPLDASGAVNINPLSSTSFATNMEPGVDGYLTMMLDIASAYAHSPDRIESSKARSWLIEVLGEMMKNPINTNMALRALQHALINSGIDTRLLRSKYSELLVQAFFATVLVTLSRFGKMDANQVKNLMDTIEVSGLSLKASSLLMTMPRTAVGYSVNLSESK